MPVLPSHAYKLLHNNHWKMRPVADQGHKRCSNCKLDFFKRTLSLGKGPCLGKDSPADKRKSLLKLLICRVPPSPVEAHLIGCNDFAVSV